MHKMNEKKRTMIGFSFLQPKAQSWMLIKLVEKITKKSLVIKKVEHRKIYANANIIMLKNVLKHRKN